MVGSWPLRKRCFLCSIDHSDDTGLLHGVKLSAAEILSVPELTVAASTSSSPILWKAAFHGSFVTEHLLLHSLCQLCG